MASRARANGPFGQMIRGLAISLRSYSRGLRVPRGGLLVRESPAVAWWDFHKSPQSIAAGEWAMRAALASASAFRERMIAEEAMCDR